MRTEKTPNGLATYIEPGFRVYGPEIVTGTGGVLVAIQLCETLEDGRWEGFYSYVSTESIRRARKAQGRK